MLVFYVFYSIHAAHNFEQTGLAGQKAIDLEEGPAVRGPSLENLADQSPADVAMYSLGPLGGAPSGLMLGRTSGGVTRLPPPTL
jgi:hypothetical protein